MRKNKIIVFMIIWMILLAIVTALVLSPTYQSHLNSTQTSKNNSLEDYKTTGIDTIDLEFELPKGLVQSLEHDHYVGYVPNAEKREHILIGDLATEGEADSPYTEWKDGTVWLYLNNTDSYSRWGIYTVYMKLKAVTRGELHINLHFQTDNSLTAYNTAQNMSELHIYFYNTETNTWVDIYNVGSQWYNYSIDVNTNIAYDKTYISADGTLYVKIYAFGNLVASGSASWSEFYIDSAWITRNNIKTTVPVEHKNMENVSAVLHWFSFDNFEYGTKVAFLKNSWTYYSIYPSATVTENSTHYVISDTVDTTYTVCLYSSDVWNYPEASLSRIAIYNNKGELLGFDNFKVYKSTTSIGWFESQFSSTVSQDEETDESGTNGFGEDFADLSEWVYAFQSSSVTEYSFTADGNVAQMYMYYNNSLGTSAYLYYKVTFDSVIDLTQYQFIEFRFKVDGQTDTTKVMPAVKIINETNQEIAKRWYYYDFDYIDNNEWVTWHLNVYELAKAQTGYYNAKILLIGFDLKLASGTIKDSGSYYLYLDWIRLYKFNSPLVYHGSQPTGAKPFLWVAWDDANGLNFYAPKEATDSWDWWWSLKFWFDDRVSIDKFRYLALNTLVDNDTTKDFNIRIRIEKADGTATYVYTSDMYFYNTSKVIDLTTLRNNLGLSKEYKYIREILFAFLASSDDLKDDWACIRYITFLSEPTAFEPVLYPIYQSYKNSIEWFKIYNIFGDLIINEPRLYATYQDFKVDMYSWKIKNQKSDFVHVSLQRNGFEFSEWLGPGEIAHYHLYPGQYTLRLTYTDNSYAEYLLDVTGDSYYLIQGTTLDDVIYNIENVNSTLYNQIINVNISLTNWNSQINSTVVNINIDLNNVNTTLGDLILGNREVITNNNSVIYNQILSNYAEINNINDTIINQILSTQQIVINNNSVIRDLINNLQSIVISNNSVIYDLLSETQSIVINNNSVIFNLESEIKSIILNNNSEIYDFLNNLENIIITNNSVLQDLINNVQNIILANNSEIENLINTIQSTVETHNSTIANLINNLQSIVINNNSVIVSLQNELKNIILTNNTKLYNLTNEIENIILLNNSEIENLINNLLSNLYIHDVNITNLLNNLQAIVIANNSAIENLINSLDVKIVNTNSSISSLINNLQSIVINNNSVIFNLESEIKSIILNNNSEIYSQILANYAKIININSSIIDEILSTRQIVINNNSVIQSLLNNLESTVINNNSVIYDLLSNVKSIVISNNSVIFNLVSDVRSIVLSNNSVIYNQIITVQNLINNMYSTMNNSFVNVNVELGIIKSNISTLMIDENQHFLVLNASIDNLNQNVTIRLADLNNTVIKNFTTTISQLNNITRLIERLYNHLRIFFYNNLTGLGIDFNKFIIEINGTRVFKNEYTTLADWANITVKDYFNRTVFTTTTETNKTLNIGIPIGELGILNNNSYTLRIIIYPDDTNVTAEFFLKPNEMLSLELILDNYTMEIYRVIYNTNTGEIQSFKKLDTITVNLNAQSQNLALDYEKEYVAVDNGILGAIFLGIIVTIVGIGIKEGWFVTKKTLTGRNPDEPIWY